MVIKEVPGWARKLIYLGLFLPFISLFWLKDYAAHVGWVSNLLHIDVEIPFLWGQNPVACLRDDIQNLVNGSLGMGDKAMSYSCQFHTLVPFRNILLVSAFMLILGVYMYARGNQLANLWPTDWKVFDQNNVRSKDDGVNLRLESPQDKPISPREGGF